MISVIVPTIGGREESLERCLDSYEQTMDERYQLIVVRDEATCGLAWNKGARLAKGDILHFTADDIEAHPGWLPPAVAAIERNELPCPRILNGDGTLQSCGDGVTEAADWSPCDFSRVPTMSIKQWRIVGPSLKCHYFTDVWFGARGRKAGIATVLRRDFLLTHYMHEVPQGRGAGMPELERYQRDWRYYQRTIRRHGVAA